MLAMASLTAAILSAAPSITHADGDSSPMASMKRSETGAPSMARASGEKLAAATGHFARARSLLIEAVREFDQGSKIANPDVLVSSRDWRSSTIDRIEDLERVLDPQPRVSKGGVRYNPDTRLLREKTK